MPNPVGLQVQMKYPQDPRLYTRDHQKISRLCNIDALDYHHRKHTIKHFQPGNRSRYGFKPRSLKYQRYKAKRYGSSVDLVKTGKTKLYVTKTRQITATGNGGRLVMRAPFGDGSIKSELTLNRIGRKITRKLINSQVGLIYRVTEIETVIKSEQEALGKIIERNYPRYIKSLGVPIRKEFK